jgi:hypothetical protein
VVLGTGNRDRGPPSSGSGVDIHDGGGSGGGRGDTCLWSLSEERTPRDAADVVRRRWDGTDPLSFVFDRGRVTGNRGICVVDVLVVVVVVMVVGIGLLCECD